MVVPVSAKPVHVRMPYLFIAQMTNTLQTICNTLVSTRTFQNRVTRAVPVFLSQVIHVCAEEHIVIHCQPDLDNRLG